MSELNEVVDLFIRQIERLSAIRPHQGPIESQALPGPRGFVLRHRLLDRSQD